MTVKSGSGRPDAYRTADGKRVPSVTTITGFLKSGALIRWAYNRGRDGFELYESRDKAGEAGSIVHQWIEDWVHGNEQTDYPDVEDELLGQATFGYGAFLEWAEQTRFQIVETEVPLVSEEYRFAGTFDALGTVADTIKLVDWKTSGGTYCHVPGTRVLTGDLRWVPVETLGVGDELWAFTEDRVTIGKGGRRWQRSRVERVGLSEPVSTLRVYLNSGRSMTVTPDHPFLTRRVSDGRRMVEGGTIWVRADELRVGNALPRYLDAWSTEESRDAEWLAGMFDGEGCVSRTTAGNMRISLTQKPGPVLNRVKILLSDRGFGFIEKSRSTETHDLRVTGGVRELARLLGSVRPLRLLPRFDPGFELLASVSARDPVIGIEPGPKTSVVNLATTSRTYFADGYGSHNSDYIAQLAAYRQLLRERDGDDAPKSAILLRLGKEFGDFHTHAFPEAVLDLGWQWFLAMKKVYEVDYRLKKVAA